MSAAAVLQRYRISASAPCRIDMGGTLDIAPLALALASRDPCTVNLALDVPTRVHLTPYRPGRVRIESRGFTPLTGDPLQMPFDHPLGLMAAVVSHFGVAGMRVAIDSTSPPRSALGGSSVAAVALVAALQTLTDLAAGRPPELDPARVAATAFDIEQAVAGVPCGRQDHLAAAWGGIACWHWTAGGRPGLEVVRRPLVPVVDGGLDRCLLVAYGGRPHHSVDINGRWLRSFVAGRDRSVWVEILACVQGFAAALEAGELGAAGRWMNRETDLRRRMTPAVLDPLGERLHAAAVAAGCGARFCGAGGGGCLWALGEADRIAGLRVRWQALLATRPAARLLAARVASRGVRCRTAGRTAVPPDRRPP